MITKKGNWAFTLIAGILMILISASYLAAQGLGSLSQLLGGNSHHSNSSGQSGGDVSVERNAIPFMGTFDGQQTSSAGTLKMDSRFACYPARDPEQAQAQAFVCYSAAREPD